MLAEASGIFYRTPSYGQSWKFILFLVDIVSALIVLDALVCLVGPGWGETVGGAVTGKLKYPLDITETGKRGLKGSREGPTHNSTPHLFHTDRCPVKARKIEYIKEKYGTAVCVCVCVYV